MESEFVPKLFMVQEGGKEGPEVLRDGKEDRPLL